MIHTACAIHLATPAMLHRDRRPANGVEFLVHAEDVLRVGATFQAMQQQNRWFSRFPIDSMDCDKISVAGFNMFLAAGHVWTATEQWSPDRLRMAVGKPPWRAKRVLGKQLDGARFSRALQACSVDSAYDHSRFRCSVFVRRGVMPRTLSRANACCHWAQNSSWHRVRTPLRPAFCGVRS